VPHLPFCLILRCARPSTTAVLILRCEGEARASKERTAVAQDEGAPRRRGERTLGMRAALEGEEAFAKVPQVAGEGHRVRLLSHMPTDRLGGERSVVKRAGQQHA